jgi:hypothetical protein
MPICPKIWTAFRELFACVPNLDTWSMRIAVKDVAYSFRSASACVSINPGGKVSFGP